tara:strand:- start:905 stop:1054 length:150 start_codon:yes stop_codon:yes gene_type:complete
MIIRMTPQGIIGGVIVEVRRTTPLIIIMIIRTMIIFRKILHRERIDLRY